MCEVFFFFLNCVLMTTICELNHQSHLFLGIFMWGFVFFFLFYLFIFVELCAYDMTNNVWKFREFMYF